MKLRSQQLLRVLAFVLLICLSAFIATVIFNGLTFLRSKTDPLSSLPSMDVYYKGLAEGTRLPREYILLDQYDWRFLFWNRTGGGKDLEPWREIPSGGWIPPTTPIDFNFSIHPKSIRVYVKTGDQDFVEIPNQNIIGPSYSAIYTFRIDANWGQGRDVSYFVKMEVPAWAGEG